MTKKTIFFGEPNIGLKERRAVDAILRSKWIGFGNESQAFERELIDYLGIHNGALVNSCTAALHLALILNKVNPGDEIITTPLTFPATSNTILYVRAKPVFVDIKLDTLNIDENLIENAITKKTKGIIVVHFGGLPCNMRAINAIAKKHKLFVIEDAEKESGAVWAKKNDPRATKFGKFLRKTRLDELPQIWNILKGEMSLIGPRAERPEFHEKLKKNISFYKQRYIIRPGLTGWAQIQYRYGASVKDAEEKLQNDLFYIKNRSLALDLSISLKTINIVLRQAGR